MARFANTSCSQCGCDLGPGDSGVSHCEDHAPKHTPGPWTAERVYWTRPNPDMRIMGGGIEVASATYSDDESHTYCTTDVEVMRANARLIAAAPELLEEVEAQYIELADFRNNWPGRHTIPGQAKLSRLRDLIAKATGRSEQDVQDDYGTRLAREAGEAA